MAPSGKKSFSGYRFSEGKALTQIRIGPKAEHFAPQGAGVPGGDLG